ncbi:DUF3307 domain-containing protein [Bacillus sp. Marseille-Q3570]|uniref:DUF3307 domain-containing protein n=1 Tax=Bacillus sp. Marseille-Q3570 TaxID=2963522 RepID=UPI0021B83291|nr:DUF3307 domain-containing protein [Bacillus sp. Marseille-Q3570]
MFQLLLLFILAHFIADFVLQKNSMIELKKRKLHKGLMRHISTHFIVMVFAGLIYYLVVGGVTEVSLFKITTSIVFILITHYLVDWVKESIKKKNDNVIIISTLFLFDQLIHVLSIIVILNMTGLISYSSTDIAFGILQFLFEGTETEHVSKFLFISILFILVTSGSGYFLGILLSDLGPNPTLSKDKYSISDEKTEIKTSYNEKGEEVNEVTRIRTEQFFKDSPKNVGRYIGMVERVLIIIFIVQGIPHGMTFLIAVKSLTRFKQFENKAFSEYYLIGSLLSALIAMVMGYLVIRIL